MPPRTHLSPGAAGLLLAVFAATLQAGATVPPARSPGAGAGTKSQQNRLAAAYGRLPLAFEANQGQTDRQVRFLSRGPGYTLFLTPTEAVLSLKEPGAGRPAKGERRRGKGETETPSLSALSPQPSALTTLRMRLVGANSRARVSGAGKLPGTVNYLQGRDPQQWRTGIATYRQVRYEAVYPGVDLVYYGNQRQLEYDFLVAPGADPGQIRLAFAGAQQVRLDGRGDLLLATPGGTVRQHKPFVYQLIQGKKRAVPGKYVLLPQAEKRSTPNTRQVTFKVGAYDRRLPLVIDPMLVYATYLGGSSNDEGVGIAVDGTGSVYVTGKTSSGDFPTTASAFDTTFNSGDAYVTKLNPSGSSIVYSTYLGGSSDDDGSGIAVDGAGSAYVTGETFSADFPVTLGALDTTFSGNSDAYVAKLNPTGSALLYSTYLGGTTTIVGGSDEEGQDIAVDAAGSAYVTGYTFSANFPTTPGAYDETANGNAALGEGDVFVAKLDPTGSALVYSTYLVTGLTRSWRIAVDGAGSAYVTALASIPGFATPGAFDTTLDGPNDAFVAKLDPAGSSLIYGTYLGGSDSDGAFGFVGIAVDSAGNAYVTGQTRSTDFPTTAGAFDATLGGFADGFVTKLDATGSTLLYSTYLGGSDFDLGAGIAVDGAGSAYVAGDTGSADFPTTADAFDTSFAGLIDVFVAKLNPSLSGPASLVYSTYLGGSKFEQSLDIAVDGAGAAYVTGNNDNGDFPATPGAFDTTFNGARDAYVAKVGPSASPPATLTLTPAAATNPVGTIHCVTATVTDAGGNPTPNVTVRFAVTGSVTTSGSATTNSSGQAQFCYTGPMMPGMDAITAYADTDSDNVRDSGEPGAAATKTWVSGAPARLILAPKTATNPVGTQHCVTATVTDAFGNPTPDVTVRFAVTGSVTAGGSATTNSSGQAQFCYTGPALPGSDSISAYADTDNDAVQDLGEPGDTAAKSWVQPASTPDCKVTGGGQITAANGDKATFSVNAQVKRGAVKGEAEYQDHGPAQPMKVKSIQVQTVVCNASKTQASLFGTATVNGGGSFNFRIDVRDLGEPGRSDTYRIRLSNGYDSGQQTLKGGNIQIH
jgi:beta-propeller repeat-containing protein